MENDEIIEINFDKSLRENLQGYVSHDIVAMHMPGHKRNISDFPYLDGLSANMDITEIDGFDNLHDAKGILKNSMVRAAALWGSAFSRFLVNGSTGGILAGMGALTRRGDTVLVARNCHKAVYSAVELFGLKPIYLCPPTIPEFGFYGSVSAQSVLDAFERNCGIKLVVVTSPTYDGIISDIKAIADIAHAHGAKLFVDEAHGAHLALFPNFCFGEGAQDAPYMQSSAAQWVENTQSGTAVRADINPNNIAQYADINPNNAAGRAVKQSSAVRCGADVVVESLHKTLPSLTQTAILHVVGRGVSEVEIDKKLAMFETSSPSYLLLSSMDGLVRHLECNKVEMFDKYHKRLLKLHKLLDKLSVLRIFNPFKEHGDYAFMCDPSKVIVSARDSISENNGEKQHKYHGESQSGQKGDTASCTSGVALQNLLRTKYRIEAEMATEKYVLFMTSVADTDESFERLTAALLNIDKEMSKNAQDGSFNLVDYNKTISALRNDKSNNDTSTDTTDSKINNIYDKKNDEKYNIICDKGNDNAVLELPNIAMYAHETCEKQSEIVAIKDAVGHISAEYVWAYPPGCPLVVPGEVLSKDLLDMVLAMAKSGVNISSTYKQLPDKLCIIKC